MSRESCPDEPWEESSSPNIQSPPEPHCDWKQAFPSARQTGCLFSWRAPPTHAVGVSHESLRPGFLWSRLSSAVSLMSSFVGSSTWLTGSVVSAALPLGASPAISVGGSVCVMMDILKTFSWTERYSYGNTRPFKACYINYLQKGLLGRGTALLRDGAHPATAPPPPSPWLYLGQVMHSLWCLVSSS